MEKYPAGSITSNNEVVPIYVADDGYWGAEYAGRTLRFESRDKLEASVKRLTKTTTVPVAVDFVRIEKKGSLGITRTRGTATGIHSGNGNVLVVWHTRHGDQKDQVKGGGYSSVDFGGVADEVLMELRELVVAKAAAADALDHFERKHKIDLKDTVLKAIKEASESDEQGS